MTVLTSLLRCHATLDVLGMRDQFQVGWVNAGTVPTTVINGHTIREIFVAYEERDPMYLACHPIDADSPISALVHNAIPFPTAFRLVYVGPIPF